jgi:hypothetical protein
LTTRAVNLFHESGLSRQAFIEALYQARAITKERSASVRAGSTSDGGGSRPTKRKIAYFFVCLEDKLGLREIDQASRS